MTAVIERRAVARIGVKVTFLLVATIVGAWVAFPLVRFAFERIVIEPFLRTDAAAIDLLWYWFKVGPFRGYFADTLRNPTVAIDVLGLQWWVIRNFYLPVLATPISVGVGGLVAMHAWKRVGWSA